MPIVAGVRLRREDTLELAALLTRQGADHTARLLLDAITRGEEFVAMSYDDRRAMLDALGRPPEGLVELRSALFAEINWRRGFLDAPRPTSPYAYRSRAG